MRNSFGHIFNITSFGESHGKAVGGIVDGMPPMIDIDLDFIQNELNRRRPGQSNITSQRKESDKVEFLSGIFNGKTTGTPIAFLVWNNDQISGDYENIKDVFRPSHADFTYYKKYGIRDYRGGGRASARESIARVVAGALAKLVLKTLDVNIYAYTSKVGNVEFEEDYSKIDFNLIGSNPVRCPDLNTAEKMSDLIQQVKNDGDTIGGIVSCVIRNCPVGIGEPQFSKLHAELGSAMLSINAAKGFEYGMGFKGVEYRGSQVNDIFVKGDNGISTKTNFSGGIQGGIANGQDVFFRVAFKPVATILKPQSTVNLEGESQIVNIKGRHDPCVVPRAVPIVEAMAAIVLLDQFLINNAYDF